MNLRTFVLDIIIYIAFHYTLDVFIRRKGGLPFTE